MSEQDPTMKLTMGGAEFEATPENTSLFMFIGRLACYNHVFLQTGENEQGDDTGTYVFNTHQSYEPMRDFMMQNGYPMHVNLREVAECDTRAFDGMIKQQARELDGGVPDEWLESGE